jgi:endonuclease/exonuclease/phosphatase family metal-dependent hydrolase
MQKLRTKSTYPGIMPFMHLDHIYYDKELVLEKVKLHRSRAALIASDHLPLVADFIMNPAHRGSEDKSIA